MFASLCRPPIRARLAALLTFVTAASTGASPSADGDIWWHLAAGRELVRRRALLHTDAFSISAAGRPWADVHWLFQLAVYGAHRAFGLSGLVAVKCLLIGLGAVLLSRAIPARVRGGRLLLTVLLLAALVAARSLLLLRPVVGSLVLLSLFFLQLERFGRDGRARHLCWLPLAQLLWANFQGISALGPALVGAFALAGVSWAWLGEHPSWPFAREGARLMERARHARYLVATALACAAASCLTPFGLRGALLPSVLFGRLLPGEHNVFSRSVAENVPPFALERLNGEFWHFKWALLLVAGCVFVAGRRLRLSHVLLLAGFGGLALLANRNVLLFYWMAAPIAAWCAAPRLRVFAAHSLRLRPRSVFALAAAPVLALSCVSGTLWARESSLAESSPFRVPVESARRLASLPPGDVFNADHQGGFLIWQLYPRFRPYIDTRLVLRTDAEYTEYLGLADAPERFDAFQARHRFSYVVLPVAFPDRYQRLIGWLYASPDWKLLFTDGTEVLFGRAELLPGVTAQDLGSAPLMDRILAGLRERFAAKPKVYAAARLHLATLAALVGQLEQVDRALSGLDSADADALRARCRLAQGELGQAAKIAQHALARDPEDVRSLNLLSLVALQRGQVSAGARLLQKSLKISALDPETADVLDHLEESQR